jgi:HlyD family secretion protein
MARLDSPFSTLPAAAVLAIAASLTLNWAAADLGRQAASFASAAAEAADAAETRPLWAASATGRVEPKDGEVRITAEAPGQIVEVLARTNDRVVAGDLLVRLDDTELSSKLVAAEAEALVRVRERDEEPVKGPALERRNAEDAAAAAERAVFRARLAFDNAARALRAGTGKPEDVTAARDKLKAAEGKLASERQALEAVNAKDGMPLPTRLESALTIARADVSQAEAMIEKTRIRAPADGTVLNVWAKVGEMAAPSPDAPLVMFGDLSTLKVRAEVEERDVVKIRLGQRAVIRVDAFPNRDFDGVVTQLAPALGTPRITTRGPRRPNDVEVLEVMVTLDGHPPLLTGMRVDAFFKSDGSASAPRSEGASVATSSIEKNGRRP